MKAIVKLTTWVLLLISSAWAGAQQQATIAIQGSEQYTNGTWDTGSITLKVNGYQRVIPYGQYSSSQGIASALGGLISEDANSPVNGQATGSSIRILARSSKGGTLSSVQIFSSGPSFSATVSTSVATVTTLGVSSTSVNSGSSVTMSAQVTPSTATGVVTFYDGSQMLAQQALPMGSLRSALRA